MKTIKKWWWVIVAGIAVVVGFVLRGLFKGGKKPEGPTFADMAKDEAAKLETDIEIKKAKAKAKTDAQLEKLEKIEQMADDKQRRKKLAEFLSGI